MSIIFLTFLLCTTSLASSFSPLRSHPHIRRGDFHKIDPTNKIHARATWAGWSTINTIFSFGDSWTDMGFSAQGAQPSLPNYPLGGPGNNVEPSKQFLLYNYISYMAVKYNDSAIEGYDLAVAGATVDNADIPHGVNDFVTQVEKIYLPIYGAQAAQNSTGNSSQTSGLTTRLSGASRSVARRARQRFGRDLRKRRIPWDPAATLFTAYFGVNDVEVSVTNATAAGSWDQEFKTYGRLLDEVSYPNPYGHDPLSLTISQLYHTGARNFLIPNLAPMDLAPGAGPGLKPLIADWNTRLETMARNLTSAYDEVTLFFFDTNLLFQQVINDPSSYPETKGLTNVTEYCPAYQKYGSTQVARPTDTGSGCAGTFEQYLWRDGLHPGLAMNILMAKEIVDGLS